MNVSKKNKSKMKRYTVTLTCVFKVCDDDKLYSRLEDVVMAPTLADAHSQAVKLCDEIAMRNSAYHYEIENVILDEENV